MTEYFKTQDGLKLAYDDTGSGPPVLCLAGLTRNMTDFDPVVAAFADRARIIRLDSRGRGQSEFDPEFMNYNLVQEGQDTLALLDHLGLERVSILGTSRGGLIAMGLAVGHADRLSGVVLNDIGPVIEPVGLTYIMSYLGNPPPFASYEEAVERLPSAMAPRFVNVPMDTWRIYAERIWKKGPNGLDLRYDPQLRQAVIEQSATGDVPDLWPFFDALQAVPTALIRGANSDLLSAETAAEMCRRQPDMIYAEVPDRGHVPFLDEPEAVAAIAAFLDRVS